METSAVSSLVAALTGDAPASALSELTALAKKKEGRTAICRALPDRGSLYALLSHAEPKVRKNAARLVGALLDPSGVPPLANALARETTRFVVPSILLALGSLGGNAAKEALAGYAAPVPQDETEQKHCEEIASALKKARAALSSDAPLPAYALSRVRDVLLTAPYGFANELRAELAERKIAFLPEASGALVHTDTLAPLLTVRCMAELLLPLGKHVPFAPTAIAKAVGNELTLPYRVELRTSDETEPLDRRGMIASVVKALPGENNPSRYGLELRIVKRGDACELFLVPSLPDERFAYRKTALPASIAPALAACIARSAADAYGETAGRALAVLDPFAGSGTLLFELEKRLAALGAPPRALIGVDIAASAVEAARTNAAAARSRAKFVQKDILRFAANEPFDLVLSNLPFGNRVGTHGSNERLYRDFAVRLPELLAGNGVALLYTMEYRLLRECIKKAPGLALVSERRTEAGGLLPWVFTVKRK